MRKEITGKAIVLESMNEDMRYYKCDMRKYIGTEIELEYSKVNDTQECVVYRADNGWWWKEGDLYFTESPVDKVRLRKSELKPGQFVVTNEDVVYIYVPNPTGEDEGRFFSDSGYLDVNRYNEDLTHKGDESFDVASISDSVGTGSWGSCACDIFYHHRRLKCSF